MKKKSLKIYHIYHKPYKKNYKYFLIAKTFVYFFKNVNPWCQIHCKCMYALF